MPKEGISPIGHSEILSYEEIARITRVAVEKGISKVRITGGEPLVRKDALYFVNLVSHIKGVEDLSMTTNGVLLKDLAQPLFDAGIKRINISLDSLKANKYREITRKDCLTKVLEGIEEVVKVGFSPVKINVVAIRGFNDDEILNFAKLTLLNPYQIRFIEFMPIGPENNWTKKKSITSQELKEKIEEFQKLLPVDLKRLKGPAKIYRFKGARGEIGFISPLSDHFCSTCNRLRLTADGKLRTCLFSDEETDLKTFLRRGCSDLELKEIIDSAVLKKPKKHNVTPSVFKKCSRTMSRIGG
jgi:cyclic pyranopterin phosphate synthase